jgi:hypothetical protein
MNGIFGWEEYNLSDWCKECQSESSIADPGWLSPLFDRVSDVVLTIHSLVFL